MLIPLVLALPASPAWAQAPVASFTYSPSAPLSAQLVNFTLHVDRVDHEPRLGPRRRRCLRRRGGPVAARSFATAGTYCRRPLRERGRGHPEAVRQRPQPPAAGVLHVLRRGPHDGVLHIPGPRRADRRVRLGPGRRRGVRRRLRHRGHDRARHGPPPRRPARGGPRRRRGVGVPPDPDRAGAPAPIPGGAPQRGHHARGRARAAAGRACHTGCPRDRALPRPRVPVAAALRALGGRLRALPAASSGGCEPAP